MAVGKSCEAEVGATGGFSILEDRESNIAQVSTGYSGWKPSLPQRVGKGAIRHQHQIQRFFSSRLSLSTRSALETPNEESRRRVLTGFLYSKGRRIRPWHRPRPTCRSCATAPKVQSACWLTFCHRRTAAAEPIFPTPRFRLDPHPLASGCTGRTSTPPCRPFSTPQPAVRECIRSSPAIVD
jgi:hypothetical protein